MYRGHYNIQKLDVYRQTVNAILKKKKKKIRNLFQGQTKKKKSNKKICQAGKKFYPEKKIDKPNPRNWKILIVIQHTFNYFFKGIYNLKL